MRNLTQRNIKEAFSGKKKKAFDDGGTDYYQDDLSMIRTEVDCVMILLGRFTIYSLCGVLKTVTDSDLSTSKSGF